MRYSRNERGTVAVMTAMALMVMMAFVSFALDSGMAYLDRRDTQNAADNAALAGAYAVCKGEDGAAAAVQWATLNGYTDWIGTDNVTVSVDSGEVHVIVQTRREALYGGATDLAPDELTIVSEAIAVCHQAKGYGDYAVLSLAYPGACALGLGNELNGGIGSGELWGGIHTNGNVQVSSGGTVVHGALTYGGATTGSGWVMDDGTYQDTESKTSLVPSYWTLSSYKPGGVRAVAAGSQYYYISESSKPVGVVDQVSGSGAASKRSVYVKLTKNAPPGLYYIDVPANAQITLAVEQGTDYLDKTFVTLGKIQFSSWTGSYDFRAFEPDGLMVYSDHSGLDCKTNEAAIQFPSSNFTWYGIVYAPNGLAQFPVSSNDTHRGSVIAWAINFSSSGLKLKAWNYGAGGGKPVLELTQ